MAEPTLFDRLRESDLLAAAVLAELAGLPEARDPDPRALGRVLLRRNLLTRFQINKLANGKAAELRIGSYLILDKLGEGGMGEVFLAQQAHLERKVALKVIRKNRLDSQEAVARFYQEVAAAGRLHHPNIVLAFDAGCWQNTHYFAMEYVNGPDLAALVREKGPLPIGLACEYVRQAAVGLHHAHERGLVHRDVKPSNLLLAPAANNGLGTVKLLDLGLARSVSVEAEGGTGISRGGAILGTPDYLAPEQARDSAQADFRSDLYSLGGTLFFLLTGRPPYKAQSLTQLLLMHVSDPPPNLRDFRPDASPELEAVIHWLMAKQPQDRPSSAAEVADYLAHFTTLAVAEVAVEPVPAPPPFPPELSFTEDNTDSLVEMPISSRRSRRSSSTGVLVGGLLVVLLAIVGGLGFVLLRGTHESPPDDSQVSRPDRKPKESSNKPEQQEPPPRIQTATPATGHLQKIQRAAFQVPEGAARVRLCPDGRRAIVAAGKTIRLIDLQSGNTLTHYPGHTATVTVLALSPTGRLLLTGDQAGQARVWEVDTGKLRNQFEHRGAVVSAAVSGDELIALTGTERLASRKPGRPGLALWDLAKGELIHDFDTESPPQVALAGDGKLGLASTADRPLMVWPLSIRPNPDPRHKPAIAGPSRLLPVGNHQVLLMASDKLLLWDLDKAMPLGELAGDKESWIDVALDVGGRRLLGIGRGASGEVLRLHEVLSLKELGRLALPGSVVSASLSSDGRHALLGQKDGTFRLLSLEQLAPPLQTMPSSPTKPNPNTTVTAHMGRVLSIAFSADGKWLVTGGEDNSARLWHVQPLQPFRVLETTQPVQWARFGRSNKQVLTFTRHAGGDIWDVETGESIAGLRVAGESVRLVGADLGLASGLRVVAATAEQLSLFEVTRGKDVLEPQHRQPAGKSPIRCVCSAPDGSALAWGDQSGMVHVYDWINHRVAGAYPAHKASVRSLAWSSKGDIIVSAGADGTLQKRSARNVAFFQNLPGHKASVNAVVFSANANRIASAAEDGSVQILNLSGKVLHRLNLEEPVEALALDAEGRYLATAGPSGVKVHDLNKPGTP